MTKDRFDLETDIMQAWSSVEDIDLIYHYIGDSEFFSGMKPEHSDKIANLLLGLKEMQELRMNKLWETFEAIVHQKLKEPEGVDLSVDGFYPVNLDRIEVIGPKGREYVRQENIAVLNLAVQDGGKTLKVFYGHD